jgi:hypothetical protein
MLSRPLPATKPWISDLRVDDLGLLWAEQYAPWEDTSPRTWDVFDTAGKLIGDVRMPTRFRAHHIGTDFIAGVATDDDGVESVRVYRLTRN